MASNVGRKLAAGRTAKKSVHRFIDLYLGFASHLPFFFLRRFGLSLTGAKIGSDAALLSGVRTLAPWRLVIGSQTIVGKGVYLDARGGLVIGDNCNISGEVAIWTAEHDVQSPDFRVTTGRVCIQDRVWLCFRSIILPGVTVGEGSVVAAGAVVTKDIPPYSIAAGIPAKVVGRRNRSLTYTLGKKAL